MQCRAAALAGLLSVLRAAEGRALRGQPWHPQLARRRQPDGLPGLERRSSGAAPSLLQLPSEGAGRCACARVRGAAALPGHAGQQASLDDDLVQRGLEATPPSSRPSLWQGRPPNAGRGAYLMEAMPQQQGLSQEQAMPSWGAASPASEATKDKGERADIANVQANQASALQQETQAMQQVREAEPEMAQFRVAASQSGVQGQVAALAQLPLAYLQQVAQQPLQPSQRWMLPVPWGPFMQAPPWTVQPQAAGTPGALPAPAAAPPVPQGGPPQWSGRPQQLVPAEQQLLAQGFVEAPQGFVEPQEPALAVPPGLQQAAMQGLGQSIPGFVLQRGLAPMVPPAAWQYQVPPQYRAVSLVR